MAHDVSVQHVVPVKGDLGVSSTRHDWVDPAFNRLEVHPVGGGGQADRLSHSYESPLRVSPHAWPWRPGGVRHCLSVAVLLPFVTKAAPFLAVPMCA